MRLTLRNSNQRAVPHDIGVPGWVQAGDTTWPGIGTTACAIGSAVAADLACRMDTSPARLPQRSQNLVAAPRIAENLPDFQRTS